MRPVVIRLDYRGVCFGKFSGSRCIKDRYAVDDNAAYQIGVAGSELNGYASTRVGAVKVYRFVTASCLDQSQHVSCEIGNRRLVEVQGIAVTSACNVGRQNIAWV